MTRRVTSWIGCRAKPLAWGLAGALFVALVVFAAVAHQIPIAAAENDGFLGMAEVVRTGRLPPDPHRPLLYVMLVAGTASLFGGDCFLAGKLVSALAAGVTVLMTWHLGRSLWGRSTGLAAAALVAIHPAFWEHGVQVSTDATFAAMFVTSTWLAVRLARRATVGAAALAGVGIALAYSTRYTAIVLLAPMGLALLAGARPGQRLRPALAFLGALALGLVPHCVLTWQVFGRPFYDETWRSFAFRHFGGGSWAYVQDNPFHSFAEVLSHDPLRILANTGEGMVDFVRRLPGLLLGAPGPVGLGFALLVTLAGVVVCWRRSLGAATLSLTLAAYVLLITFTFFPWERIVLPVLPLLLLLLAWALLHLPRAVLPRAHRRRLAPVVAMLGGCFGLLAIGAGLPERLARFVAQHPNREVEVARALVDAHGPDHVLLTSYAWMLRLVGGRCITLVAGPDPAATHDILTDLVMTHDADSVVLGQATVQEPRFAALAAAVPPPHFRRLGDDPSVLAYAVAMLPMDDVVVGGPTVRPGEDGGHELGIEFRSDAPPMERVVVSIAGPGGIAMHLSLPAASERRFATKLQLPPISRGVWTLVARCQTRAGVLHRGQPVQVTLP